MQYIFKYHPSHSIYINTSVIVSVTSQIPNTPSQLSVYTCTLSVNRFLYYLRSICTNASEIGSQGIRRGQLEDILKFVIEAATVTPSVLIGLS